MRYTYDMYKANLCSAEEYLKSQYGGEVYAKEIYTNRKGKPRYIYIIVRKDLVDYDGDVYTEYKIYDIDTNRGCIDKEKDYANNWSVAKYWKFVNNKPDMKRYVYYLTQFEE